MSTLHYEGVSYSVWVCLFEILLAVLSLNSKLIYSGFLFRAQPTLMTLPRSASVMDEIFASPEEEGRGRLLKIIQEFLVSEVSKHSAKEKGNFLESLTCRYA